MSFNISGVVINKSFEDNKEELSKVLGFNIDFEKEIDFVTASENWKEEGIIDVYFSEKGTLIFANYDLCLEGYSYPQINILTFALSEASMTFSFEYSENDNIIRSKMDVNGEIIDENGEKLQVENENDDISEVIWKQIETVLGKPFLNIELEEKAFRFLIKNNSFTVNQPIKDEVKEFDKFDFLVPISREKLKSEYSQNDFKELFDKMIKYAQQNTINIFLQPNFQEQKHYVFMKNFVALKETISEDSGLFSFFNSKIILNAFQAFGKANRTHIDSKTNTEMMQMIMAIKPVNQSKVIIKNSKKWWQFWK